MSLFSFPPHLVLLFTWDVSLGLWEQKGLLQREMLYYKRLAERGVRITLLTWGGHRDSEIGADFSDLIQVVPLYKSLPCPKNKILRAAISPLSLWGARDVFKSAAIIKTNQMWGGWIAVLARYVFRKPLLVRTGFELYRFTCLQGHSAARKVLIWLLSKLTYATTDLIYLATEEDRAFVEHTFSVPSSKIRVRPNWIDTAAFAPGAMGGNPSNASRILYVGRMNVQKNLPLLIEAVAGTNIGLDLIGDGELRDELERFADGKKANVRFLGSVPNNQMPAIYRSYPVFALVSDYEGNPKSLLEAMSCGCAVLGANSEGIRSLIRSGKNGLLCEKDVDSVRNSLHTLMTDHDLRNTLGQNARSQILETQSLDMLIEREIEDYASLLKKNEGKDIMSKLSHLGNIAARRVQKFSDRWAKFFWHDYPFGRSVCASKDQYLSLWEDEKASVYPEIDSLESRLGFSLDKAWMDDLALHTQIVVKGSPLCYQHGRILYAVLRDFIKNRSDDAPLTIFETGTARGFSAVIMAKALKDSGCAGKIVTFDILPHAVPMYWNCIDDHEGTKSRYELLAPWQDLTAPYILFIEGDSRINLSRVAADRIEFAFLDGAHGYDDVLFEFRTVAARQKIGDLIVFDDYNEKDFAGLVRAVDDGCRDMGYSKDILQAGPDRKYVVARRIKD